jgi:hypothetical protein
MKGNEQVLLFKIAKKYEEFVRAMKKIQQH